MSLRAFHLFFIAASVILATFTAAWAGGQYRATHETMYLITAVAFVCSACGLGAYMSTFVRKTRNL